MVKKVKEGTLNLYNFNAEDEKNNIKAKKKQKRRNKAKKQKQNDNIKKKENELFSFDNEIVIGIPKPKDVKIENAKDKTNKKKKKISKKQQKRNTIQTSNQTSKRKIEKRNTKKKSKKNISKKQEQIKKQNRIIKFRIIKYICLIVCVLALIIVTMTSPLFNIKEIIVEGNEKITSDEIISLSQINLEENTYKTSIKKAKQKILENPYIKNVEIKRKLPSKMVITVEERKTTFMFEYGSGYVYINNQGYILEISSEKLEIPIIQGAETPIDSFVAGNRLLDEDLIKMSTVIKIMEIAENNEISNLITRIDIQNSKNYKIVFESEQKVAYLGDETDLNTKILSIKSIIEKEKGKAGEIFVNMDLKSNYPTFRQNV